MEGYCLKCKAKREIVNPAAGFLSNGRPTTSGTCSVCGSKIHKMGSTDAHAGLTPPPPAPKPEKKRKGAHGKTGDRGIPHQGQDHRAISWARGTRCALRSDTCAICCDPNFPSTWKTALHPKYRIPNEKRPLVKELKALAKDAAEVYLATDPDREGEAIAWHLMEATELGSGGNPPGGLP